MRYCSEVGQISCCLAGEGISFHLNGMKVKAALLRDPQSEDVEPARGWERLGLTVKSLNLQNLLQNLWNSPQDLWR